MTVVERIIGIVAPHDCMVCGIEGSLLCQGCWLSLGPVLPQRCYRCYAQSENSKTCTKCRHSSKLGHVWVRSEYTGATKQLIASLKFGRTKAASQTIAKATAEALPSFIAETIFVPIPTATSRRRQRGYDQAVLVAKQISSRCDLPMSQLLIRLGQTRQVGTKRNERLAQLKGSFIVKDSLTPGSHIILVDDVLTTGATLEAAAQVLRKAGARCVDAVIFAQA